MFCCSQERGIGNQYIQVRNNKTKTLTFWLRYLVIVFSLKKKTRGCFKKFSNQKFVTGLGSSGYPKKKNSKVQPVYG